MIIYIDVSVFSEEGGACGNVSGKLELQMVPQIGDSVSFTFSAKNKDAVLPTDFDGILTVTDRVVSANVENQEVLASLSLSDVMVPTRESALKVMDYLESAFGLFSDVYFNPESMGSDSIG
jgi:hypothetical protein